MNKSRLIIGGDFNCLLNSNDRLSSVTDRSTHALTEVLEHFNMIDVWKYFNPGDVEFTYIDPSPNMYNSRIDLLLCSKALKSVCSCCNICQSPAPDHKVVTLQIKVVKNERGKGYWKMNCNVLKNKDYELGITEIYNNVISEYGQHVSKSLLWDYLKIKIKEYSIAYGIEQARSYKDNCKKLESELNDLDKVLTKHKDIATHQKRKEIKQQLDEYYAKKARGYQIRSRARWVEEGEQSTKYFLGLEKSRQSFNCISSLKDSNGHTALTDNEILDVAHSFYTDLYKSKSEYREEIRSAFDTLIPENVLNAELQEKCEGLVTKHECYEAIKSMKRNKSGG